MRLNREIDGCADARDRRKHADRSSANLEKVLRARNQAILTGLGRRALYTALEIAREHSANAPVPSSANSHRPDGSEHSLYPTQYRVDNMAIERRAQAEELEIGKPTAHEKRITSRTKSYFAGGFRSVMSRDRDIAWHQDICTAAGRRTS